MAGEQLSFILTGGPPWGIRLMGGEGEGLEIARLRARSKASESGLREGDLVSAINGAATGDMTHAAAMHAIESAGHTLRLDITRGGRFAPVPQMIGLSRSPVPNIQVNGTASHVSRVNLNHVPRQETFSSVPRRTPSPQPPRSFVPVHPATNKTFKPSVFQPAPQSAYCPPEVKATATPMVANNDGSFSISVGLSKAPAPASSNQGSTPKMMPQFTVKKVSTGSTPKWQPLGQATPPVPASLRAESPIRSVTPAREESPEPPTGIIAWPPAHLKQESQIPIAPPTPMRYAPLAKLAPAPARVAAPRRRSPSPAPLPLHDYVSPMYLQQADQEEVDLHKYVRGWEAAPGEEDYEIEVAPRTRKKKIYADSAFYDDPEHRYPTIEEQIKMAKKVALSLMAPQNKQARGHKMFVKRRQKSDKWIAAGDETQDGFITESEDEKYFNPDPWRYDARMATDQQDGSALSTWQPPAPAATPQMSTWSRLSTIHPWHTPPEAPPLPVPSPAFQQQAPVWAPRLPAAAEPDDPYTNEEMDRIEMNEQLNTHDGVSPAMAFSLANDLRNMEGKGGQLFAKRRERSDQYVIQNENPSKGSSPNPDIMQRIAGQSGSVKSRSPAPSITPTPQPKQNTNGQQPNAMPVNRLDDMISNKPTMTPWEAAQTATDGSVEAAFKHLERPAFSAIERPAGFGQPPAKKPTSSVFTPAPHGSHAQALPTESSSSSSVMFTIPDPTSSNNYNTRIQAWGQAADDPAMRCAKIRPINFKPPNTSRGVFETTSASMPWSANMVAVGGPGSNGYCDL